MRSSPPPPTFAPRPARGTEYRFHLKVHVMKRSTKAPESRMWRASLIRKPRETLGTVWAPDREAAEAAAVGQFGLSDEQRKRLVLQEHL
jgi:hypothetical protein